MTLMPQDGTVRIGIAAAVPEILSSLGVDPEDVFSEARIDIRLFDNQDNLISYAARGHLLSVCVERTGCEHFGLLLGQNGSLSNFGLIGHLAKQSPDVKSALMNLQRYFHLHAQGARLELTEVDRLARLGYHIYQPHVEATAQIDDGAMAWGFNILRELAGDRFKLAAVHFTHRMPRDTRPYNRLFKAPIRFDSEEGGLYFRSEFLSRSLVQSDPDLHRLLQKDVDQIQATYHDDFLSHVRRVLHSVLWVRPASAAELAALFSMSRRTLNRRLSTVDTTFREVADEVKCQIACQMLSDSEIQLTDLATLLHYHDSSSFVKAFRRWTGSTPAQWRLENKS